MMHVNTHLRSLLLFLSVMMVFPIMGSESKAEPIPYITDVLISFATDHPVLIGSFCAIWAMFNARLETRKTENFKISDLREDYKEFLDSLNIFDTKLYRQLIYMFDKYIIGVPVKIIDKAVRRKVDNEIHTYKESHLKQKPFGLYGLTHAYVLKPLKSFMEFMVPLAGAYILIVSPIQSFRKSAGGGK